MTMGERIRLRREQIGMTQSELADRIGYKSKTSINKIELNIQNLAQSKIKAIADALDTSPGYIMGWDNLPQPDLAFFNYLRSLGYIIEANGSDPIAWENGSPSEWAHVTTILIKDGVRSEFTDEEWDSFQKAVEKTIEYQIWYKNQKK